MPIPFRDADDIDRLGTAGFLGFLHDPDRTAVAGGILLVDARAEPIEFVHHWMMIPGGALWSAQDASRYTQRRLAADLFGALGGTPSILLLHQSDANGSWLGDLEVDIPVGFIAATDPHHMAPVRWLDEAAPPPGQAVDLHIRLAERDLLSVSFTRLNRALHTFHSVHMQGPTT